jgi:cyanophycinase
MSTIYLHGGGDHPESRAGTFGRFAAALGRAGRLALIVAEADQAEGEENALAYRAIFAAVGLSDEHIHVVYATPQNPLTADLLRSLQPNGVFVCGGSTPFYHQALCSDKSWVDYLKANAIPYGGTSAGAAIAAEAAIIGGWQTERAGQARAIMFSGAGEGLQLVTVVAGLGLVPFSIDAHASQWGTLLRLIHAVDIGLTTYGWAIDEDTQLEVNAQGVAVYGRGQAYEVRRGPNGVEVAIHIQ